MSSINKKEIEHFAKDSSHWWDEDGPFKPLHRMNPVRLHYIKEQICTHYNRNFKDLRALKDLSVLDVGCGGGLICEPMARMGADVTGIDADANAINVAKDHATQSGLDIHYTCGGIEDHSRTYDVVLALEIIEHVQDPQAFVQSCVKAVNKGGIIIFSTLNRTTKSYALGIVAAEYVLGWVPRGTHNWKQFIRPSELSRFIRQADCSPKDMCGLTFDPIKNAFKLSKADLSVNYFVSATK